MYDKPIVRLEDSSTLASKDPTDNYQGDLQRNDTVNPAPVNVLPSEEDAILRSHRIQDEFGGSVGVQHKLLNRGSQVTKEIKRRLITKCTRVLILETDNVEAISLSVSLSSLARDLIDTQNLARQEEGQENIVMAETVNFVTQSKLLLITSGNAPVEVIENTDLEAG